MNYLFKYYTLDNKFIRETYNFVGNFTGFVIYNDENNKIYFKDGLYHCEEGPAFITREYEKWYINNRLHRLGGAAVIRANGSQEYWVDGKPVTELEHNVLYGIMKLKGLI
jgi:hypothetical protein